LYIISTFGHLGPNFLDKLIKTFMKEPTQFKHKLFIAFLGRLDLLCQGEEGYGLKHPYDQRVFKFPFGRHEGSIQFFIGWFWKGISVKSKLSKKRKDQQRLNMSLFFSLYYSLKY